jgi:predicted DCC family thiol-disulfide oxidoreductase YuxK
VIVADARDRSLLVFDGDCAVCTRAADAAERGFGPTARAVAWQSLSPAELSALHLTEADVAGAAWWVDPTGRRERGHRAIARALQAAGGRRRLLGDLILLPVVRVLAAGLYRVVVVLRHAIPGSTRARGLPGPVGR